MTHSLRLQYDDVCINCISTFSLLSPESFKFEVENPLISKVKGKKIQESCNVAMKKQCAMCDCSKFNGIQIPKWQSTLWL